MYLFKGKMLAVKITQKMLKKYSDGLAQWNMIEN